MADGNLIGRAPPFDWSTAGRPMTPEQAAELRALAEAAHLPAAFDESLTRGEAALRVHALRAELARP